MSIQRNLITYMGLVGMENGTVTLERSLTVYYKLKHIDTI